MGVYLGLNSVDIFGGQPTGSVTPTYQAKTATPTESQQIISRDEGYDALSSVTVEAISSTYVGTGISRRSSSDLSRSGATVTVPSGYYSSQETKSVSSVTHANPTVSVNTSTGLITASHTQSAGYIRAGTTTETSQLTTKARTTYNTSSSDQTIASGTYLTGTQTIRAVTHTATAAKIAAGQTVNIGDAGSASRVASVSGSFSSDATASAGEIVSGETAYVNGSKVTGTLVINKYYTGSSAPASSLGSNGDIYIQA